MNFTNATVYGNSVVHVAYVKGSRPVATLCGSEGRQRPTPLVASDREVTCPKCSPAN